VDEVSGARRAEPSDAALITQIMTAAFFDDPVWGPWAFPDVEHRVVKLSTLWRFLIDAAIPNRWVWVTPGGEAASLWVPPGCPELPPEYEERLHPLLTELLGSHGDTVSEGFERFDAAHPHDEPHYYLSLLATDPALRGLGHGMALLAENLVEVDREGMAAYLESTNPNNDRRYERQGFGHHGSFAVPGGPTINTMWRQARKTTA
jgi:GNAT superfamily N-acetyltransferase